ncbi:MAG: hypothetical protein JNJ59_23935 [Deltaproteobacteria bacterium]|nr:hypothetical protein [Deltaproteobacteria bacterium]
MQRALVRHDRDRSGTLDAPELAAIDCAFWDALEQDVRQDLGTGFAELYGLAPGFLFRAGPLGITPERRTDAHRALMRCAAVVPRDESPTERVLAQLAAIRATTASAEWDGEVADILVASFDQNRSGLIDAPIEVVAVPCEVWVALDRAIQAERGAGLLALYGFAPGYIWVGQMLGVSEDQRDRSTDLMVDCGLDD